MEFKTKIHSPNGLDGVIYSYLALENDQEVIRVDITVSGTNLASIIDTESELLSKFQEKLIENIGELRSIDVRGADILDFIINFREPISFSTDAVRIAPGTLKRMLKEKAFSLQERN